MWTVLRKWWERICSFHRTDDTTGAGQVRSFFLPRLSAGFFLRMGVLALLAFLIFGFVLIPCIIDGESMMPTFPSKGFTFCWRGRYLFGKPERGDIVIVRFTDKVFFLKRVVALPGETVEFRDGVLYVNREPQHEPYLRYASTWNLKPRTVEPGHYYVVGDNRSQPIEQHKFGQVLENRIMGSPLLSFPGQQKPAGKRVGIR